MKVSTILSSGLLILTMMIHLERGSEPMDVTYLCCSQAVGWAREEKYFDQELPFILSGKLIKRALRVLKCSENNLKQPLEHLFSSFYSECGFLVTRLRSL